MAGARSSFNFLRATYNSSGATSCSLLVSVATPHLLAENEI